MNRSTHLMPLLLLALFATLAAACVAPPLIVPAQPDMDAETDTRSVNPTIDVVTDPAMVDSVTVQQQDGEYVAVVGGSLPDSCTEVGDSTQQVNGDSIEITLLTERPVDAMCAMMMSPFLTEITIDVSGLEPGEYTIVVNGLAADETISV